MGGCVWKVECGCRGWGNVLGRLSVSEGMGNVFGRLSVAVEDGGMSLEG